MAGGGDRVGAVSRRPCLTHHPAYGAGGRPRRRRCPRRLRRRTTRRRDDSRRPRAPRRTPTTPMPAWSTTWSTSVDAPLALVETARRHDPAIGRWPRRRPTLHRRAPARCSVERRAPAARPPQTEQRGERWRVADGARAGAPAAAGRPGRGSGERTLARLLACMSAAVAQQLAVLPGGGRMTPLDALQIALAGEHAARLRVRRARCADLGVGRRRSCSPTCPTAYATHRCAPRPADRLVRDAGRDAGRGRGRLRAARDAEHAARVTGAALGIERALRDDVRLAGGEHRGRPRRWAIDALTDAAVRELSFRGSPEIFPGAGESADR